MSALEDLVFCVDNTVEHKFIYRQFVGDSRVSKKAFLVCDATANELCMAFLHDEVLCHDVVDPVVVRATLTLFLTAVSIMVQR